MQEQLMEMKQELARILAGNKALKQALREVNKLDMIKASLIVRTPKHQSLKIDRILDGDLPTDVAVGDFVFIENYCELVKSFDHEMTEEEKASTIQWETRQLEIMDWFTDDVDWITGESHEKMENLMIQKGFEA